MNRIRTLFREKGKDILSIYYTAGFPALEETVAIARYLEQGGADMIEIGIPFSDPIADGPTIQESNRIALNNGMSVRVLLSQIREIRSRVDIPIMLMGYLNPILQYGVEQFIHDAAASGVDGVIIPDMPFREFEEEYRGMFESADLCHTFLISPTTSTERIREIDAASSGFIYAVSASSTTGAKEDFSADQIRYFETLQGMNLNNPFLIGFGISSHATFSKAAEYASGAIIGSAFVDLLKSTDAMERDVMAFVGSIRGESFSHIYIDS